MNFLEELKELKGRLIERILPRPTFSVNKPRREVIELIGEVDCCLKKKNGKNGKQDRARILADFLNELEADPWALRDAISEYNVVYASTLQQSEGTDIRRAKSKDRKEPLVYDTVIVDEAARCSPRDLLIPMAQAENRIILVGDHRQLPHIFDEAVERELEKAEGNDQAKAESMDYIRRSMFQYLKGRLKKLQAFDKQPRSVTLDAQFRMHPLLGNFVSKQFYDEFDEHFDSPRSADEFTNNLSGTKGKPALWLNVPTGQEKKSQNKSRYRESEAEAIAAKLKSWMDSKEGEGLSFGVISFYREQANRIHQALSGHGCTTKGEGGEWRISDEYAYVKDSRGKLTERLRIGTVDSFQGMEFDVVFLSMVRTGKLPTKKEEEKKRLKIQQGLFGHLMSPNRLCVSMSRQRRLLVVVGDSKMLTHEIAGDAVPALCDFWKFAGAMREV